MHMPPEHVWPVHGAGAPQVPVMSQVSTPLFEHWSAFGEHWTQAPARHTDVAPAHIV